MHASYAETPNVASKPLYTFAVKFVKLSGIIRNLKRMTHDKTNSTSLVGHHC